MPSCIQPSGADAAVPVRLALHPAVRRQRGLLNVREHLFCIAPAIGARNVDRIGT